MTLKKILTYLFLNIPLILFGNSKGRDTLVSTIKITGNWQDENGFKAAIQTREPELKENESKTFLQKLKLEKGSYKILFEYESEFDKALGAAFRNNLTEFKGFKVNGSVKTLTFSSATDKKGVYRAECHFTVVNSSVPVKLQLTISGKNEIKNKYQE